MGLKKEKISGSKQAVFGKKIGLMGTLFGCRHKQLSRPFTYGAESYCVCLNCGARKNFNAETLTTTGSFYFPPPQASI